MVISDLIRATPVTLGDNARTVLERRYLLRDESGAVVETPEEMLARVAEAIASVEPEAAGRREWAQRFYDEMAALRFLPNSPTLMNAGTGAGTLAACFVLPVEDTLESIMSTAQAAAMVQKFGGGTGFSFSRLRGVGEPIASTHGAACGPVSVLKHYDDVSRLVTQGGKREGANMGILRVDHPDIREFIHAKDDGETAQRFNLSVGVTNEFLEAAARGEWFELRDPRDGTPRGTVDAAALLDEIAQAAWSTGDPGLVFLDEINRHNPTPALGEIEATNPCGEVPLLAWEACTLGSLNVRLFWDDATQSMDWAALRESVGVAVRFLDNVVEANTFPVPEIAEAVAGNRKIGLGMMGWADLLIAAGLPYASDEALQLSVQLASEIGEAANAASATLGAEKGVFPNWERSVYAGGPRYRNATRTCIAPTGTIAIIAGASSGIEPLFSLAHYRRMGDGTVLSEVSTAFQEAAHAGGYYSDELMAALTAGVRLAERAEVPEADRARFATAHEIEPAWHVRMQAAFQGQTDLAVSKTVNLPGEATVDDVRAVYTLAHELGCKGVTVYRDGSRAVQVLAHAIQVEEASDGAETSRTSQVGLQPRRRHLADERQSLTHKFRVGEQEGYITVGLYEDGSPGEVFIKIAKEGSTVSGLTDAVALLTSIALQYGVSLDKLADKLEQTRFEPYGITPNPEIPFTTSLLDYVFRWLRLHFGSPDWGSDDAAVAGDPEAGAATLSGLTCPDCGMQLLYAERCLLCESCGYSKCG